MDEFEDKVDADELLLGAVDLEEEEDEEFKDEDLEKDTEDEEETDEL